MKQGWEYKKLDSCAYIEYGTRVVQKKDGGTIYPVYGGGGETFRIDRFNREDCLIVARFAMSPLCVRYVKGKFFLNDSGLSVKAGKELYQSYLNHHIKFLNNKIYNLGKGAAQRNLDVKSFKNLQLGIPPKSTQLTIVSELDKINELIRLKKEQLKDCDNLAQSIFYEMFGDPVENDKGWEVKKLGEIGIVKTGNTPARSNERFYNENFIEWIKTDNIRSDRMYPTTAAEYLSKEGAECGRIVSKDSILVACIAGSISSIGKCCITTKEVAFNQQINAITPNKDLCNSIYLYKLIVNSSRYIQQNATTGMKHILSKSIFEQIQIPLPPLPLQHLFAQRIEQIERQKSAVQKSITDLETLLASRMQYWFE